MKIGLNCKFYRGDAGSIATTEVKNVRDVSTDLSLSTEDATTREAEGWEVIETILFSGNLEWEMLAKDTTDANLTAFRTAFLARTAIALAVLDKVNGEGMDADYKITGFKRQESLKGIVSYAITAQPVFETRAPRWKPPG